MGCRVVDLGGGESDWSRVVAAAGQCDPFQSLAWLRAERDCHGRDVQLLLAHDRAGSAGGMGIITRRLPGGLRGHEALGGPVARPEHETAVGATVVLALREVMGSGLYHAVRPTAPHELHEPLLAAGYRCSPLPTIVVDLTPTPEALWSRLDKKTRNGIRKGLKVGVEVSPADDWAAWEQFLELQHRHAASHGLAALGPDHCRYYFEVLRAAGACRLFIARLGSELACGMLFIIGEGTMRYFISCSRSDMLHCSPNDPTMWHAIRWGHASGLRWLDLYDTDPRPGSPLAGIHHFKSRWGGALVDRPYYIRGALYHWLRERKREAAGRGLMFRLLQRAGA